MWHLELIPDSQASKVKVCKGKVISKTSLEDLGTVWQLRLHSQKHGSGKGM
jgi:hypothetical protein